MRYNRTGQLLIWLDTLARGGLLFKQELVYA